MPQNKPQYLWRQEHQSKDAFLQVAALVTQASDQSLMKCGMNHNNHSATVVTYIQSQSCDASTYILEPRATQLLLHTFKASPVMQALTS